MVIKPICNKTKNMRILKFLIVIGFIVTTLCACGSGDEQGARGASGATRSVDQGHSSSHKRGTVAGTGEKGSRSNAPVCLVPVASGVTVFENDLARIDASNTKDGYVIVKYTGSSDKVKLQVTGPTEVTYTYSLSTSAQLDEVFPLQCGDGEYMINVFENIEGTKYSLAFSHPVEVTLTNEFSPFLFPNQYVTFTSQSKAVEKGSELAFPCNTDLDVVSEVYNFMIENITYDHEEAESVQSGYIPDVDEVLETRTGICLDYAALMTAMLRSQRIPTRMEIGYAGTAYHAWLSTYITDVGWVNGIIEFDGKDWSLMDPTFASNLSEKKLKDFIGDGTNYQVKYIY